MLDIVLTGGNNIKKLYRALAAGLLAFGFNLWIPENAHATCINTIQAQTIAAAYEGDETPTVHHMNTCSGDDVSYQIPIATTITFDGVQYSNIYATTNSVITFGQPDGTFWNYPNTPSISLYSMDWFPGRDGTSGLDIYYSEGGFQINLNMVPFGSYGAEPSTVNILVAITNTGGISVAYSYQGPEYQNMRTGVRLHDGSIVSLEAWGATQIEAGEEIPTLEPEPVPEPSPSPTGPTQEELEEQARQEAEQARVQEEIRVVNNLLASAAGLSESIIVEPVEEPSNELPPATPEPEVPPVPEPDIEVLPEVVTPEDPRFPEEEINPEDPATRPEEPKIEDEVIEKPQPEPTEEETNQEEVVEEVLPEPEEIINEEVIVIEDKPEMQGANLLADLTSPDTLSELTPEQQEAVSKTLGVSTNDLLKVAELAQSDPVIAEALQSFTEKLEENKDAPMPYTLADAIVEERVEELLSNPTAIIGDMLDVDLGEIFGNLSSLGSDMTDDQREKAQEVIVPVIIASNIVAAAMTRRK